MVLRVCLYNALLSTDSRNFDSQHLWLQYTMLVEWQKAGVRCWIYRHHMSRSLAASVVTIDADPISHIRQGVWPPIKCRGVSLIKHSPDSCFKTVLWAFSLEKFRHLEGRMALVILLNNTSRVNITFVALVPNTLSIPDACSSSTHHTVLFYCSTNPPLSSVDLFGGPALAPTHRPVLLQLISNVVYWRSNLGTFFALYFPL